MKQLLITDDYSVSDDRICPPPTMRPADLGDLLSIVTERLADGGVLMLSGTWADYVRPFSEHAPDQAATVHTGDWSAKVARDDIWVRWAGPDGAHVWTCEADALPPAGKNSPLADANPMITALNTHTWADTAGAPWVGTPGMTGNTLLIDTWAQLHPKAPEPKWSTTGIWLPQHGGDDWAYGHIEQPYTPAKWSRDYDGPLHGYDLNLAYLSAYQVADLPANALEHRNPNDGLPVVFDPRLGGLWRVDLAPWPFAHLLPDPAGYGPVLEDGSRWLTTPTVTLLQQLADRGDHPGFTVREAWTAPSRRITRRWAELVKDIIGAAREPLPTAARQVYKQTYGMWVRRGRVYRPDWHYTLIATARANLWRKIDTAYRGHTGASTLHGTTDVGQGPVRIETDAVFYPGADDGHPDNWADTAPHGFKLDPTGTKVGHFKPYAPKGER